MSRLELMAKWFLGIFFVLAGVNHFVRPGLYLKIMPPYLPWPLALVYVSGFCEVALGALFLVPRYQTPAAWGLIALLIAVFPANLHMALHAEQFSRIPPLVLWLRLPLQAALIAWVYRYTRG
jgi:uncharacterized membrane protein